MFFRLFNFNYKTDACVYSDLTQKSELFRISFIFLTDVAL